MNIDTFNQGRDSCGIGALVNIDGRKDHSIVDRALSIVERLEHRAGKDATGTIGDGVGILLQISHPFFALEAKKEGIVLPEQGDYAIAMLFLPVNKLSCRKSEQMFETIAKHEGATILGWRDVPCNVDIISDLSKEKMPIIRQCFISRPQSISRGKAFEKALYVIRRQFEKSCPDAYVVSLSSKTIVYKGMVLVSQLRKFYLDLDRPSYTSALAIVHSRFSTNTNPNWQRAQPYHMLAHNGEINTIRGNRNRMLAREADMKSDFLSAYEDKILPVIDPSGSDSAMLDNSIEFLYQNGMPIEKAMMITIPSPWYYDHEHGKRRDFYQYYATMMEPWDGPAAILFSDGIKLGATLDRNGLRPLRWWLDDKNTLVLSSEVGVLPINEAHIVKKSRLCPGQMLLVDTKKKELYTDATIKDMYALKHPYGEWLDRYLVRLKDLPASDKKQKAMTISQRHRAYKLFGYTYEDLKEQILPMAQNGSEPIASMGTDIPLAALSDKHPSLFHYFKQQFAQVTNPPIDSMRETIVTDTTLYLGSSGNILEDVDRNCSMLEIHNPILDGRDMDKIRSLKHHYFHVEEISLLFYQGQSLQQALEDLFVRCDQAFQQGANLLVLSDRNADEEHLVIPALLAVSALEQHFVKIKKKNKVSLILETAEARDVHQFALLLGYGVGAIYPYLAHESILEMIERDVLDKEPMAAIRDYNDAIIKGVIKIASKMGISTLQSYQSAQIFEAIGLNQDVIDHYFTHTPCQVGGVSIEKIDEDIRWYHDRAFDPVGLSADLSIDSIGFHRLRNGKDKERHLYDPKVIVMLQRAVREGNYDLFKEYSKMINQVDRPFTIRSLLTFVEGKRKPISIDEVESVDSIVKRFKTGAMSYGSISEEAHTTMAIAMNRLGGKSNSGEGGEKPERLNTEKNSAIKQVASGRFGVTSEYLTSAKEIQIKMAQGAKPGEGGHLPGKKVYPWIAKTRYSTPGVSLISPPPHHDIYSIEDLAQLIYDLKNANPKAGSSVKLVSEDGIGTIACGVAKAGAQVILVSGYDGGTGAAAQSSIHHAGLPWEVGLNQVHEQLIKQGLRSRVRLETDGKLMSGKDVAVACLLGAEEFGFATGPLVAMGCMMMRVCNLDTCPVGIATQNQCLRDRFKGKPEHVMNYMRFMASELREIMASLGFATVDEMVGHKECLCLNQDVDKNLDIEDLLELHTDNQNVHFEAKDVFDFQLEKTKDASVLIPAYKKALSKHEAMEVNVTLDNTDRAFGTLLGSYKTMHKESCDQNAIIHAKGSAGQSLGAFLPEGIEIEISGDANDYFGKGLSGGMLSIYPSNKAKYVAKDNVIIGNVALYGATSGKAFISGLAGERFAVRNSGAIAVVEGCGDHALEYMTGGVVVILGQTGKNVAAGMSGGVGYIFDPDHDLYLRVNRELVDFEEVREQRDITMIHSLVEEHVKQTHSKQGSYILDHFDTCIKDFKKIIGRDYRWMMDQIEAFEKQGMTKEQASLAAFEKRNGV